MKIETCTIILEKQEDAEKVIRILEENGFTLDYDFIGPFIGVWASLRNYAFIESPLSLGAQQLLSSEFISRYSAPVGDGVTDYTIAIQKSTGHVIHVDYVMDGATAEYLINNGYDIVVEPGGCIDYSKPDQDDRPLSAREQAWLDKQNQPPAPEPEREANIPDLPDNTFDPRLGWLR